MSNPYNRKLNLMGVNPSDVGEGVMSERIRAILEDGLHGVAFSPYTDGQDNSSEVTEGQIRARMSMLAPYTRWVRTFSCTRGNELAPAVATELGLKTMVGAWIDADLENNEIELANSIAIAKRGDAGILAIGNEVMLREELTEDQLIAYIEKAKAEVDIPVGYVDAYFLFEKHPRVAEACDVLLVNCYPFWEGYPIEHAHIYMREMYRRAQRVANGKKVIIAETGWPNVGTRDRGAEPSRINAMKYFIDAVEWTGEEGIELFYFAGFDEAWKVAKEGDVGAFWGLWDKDGKPKYHSA
ncbi:glycosyl hydrolase family 17 protein [Hyphobacterium sp. HN65]|uniref:Endo-1,3-beta-glucanase btgC n=1 Tax=Hyphobacterium lacteum TaxID=3116575 RepID=A0ABU7LSG5_9PROT|nr:glycosyl hydrolase family 17 protein [Hyphobacterium sp. HN65]MEE2526849.1 glycosyl hydrolase family 17 protein [Hyphobacterium sp. HN65]